MTTRTSRDVEITEKAFQAMVVQYAKLLGWKTYHTLHSKGSEPGYPDLCLVRGERIVYAELKRERGRVSPAQQQWLDALSAAPGNEVYVWRPSSWDAIEEVLR